MEMHELNLAANVMFDFCTNNFCNVLRIPPCYCIMGEVLSLSQGERCYIPVQLFNFHSLLSVSFSINSLGLYSIHFCKVL